MLRFEHGLTHGGGTMPDTDKFSVMPMYVEW